jgi:hypothetical protein
MFYEEGIGFALIAIIAITLSLTAILLVSTIFRRAYNARKYARLDRERLVNRKLLLRAIESGLVSSPPGSLSARPKTVKWIAIEGLLMDFIAEEKYRMRAKELFVKLGYTEFYEGKLKSRNVIRRAAAVDALGKMRSEASTDKLVPMLDDESTEIVAVAVRSLSRIGAPDALKGILRRLPRLLTRSRVTRKAVETALKNFGTASASTLIEFGERYIDPVPKASILEVLSNMAVRESLPFATASLDHADPEVRSKALKLIAAAGAELPDAEKNKVLSRLEDSVWFVRLQAAKALTGLRYGKAEDALAARLLDENWQVRNAAATALAVLDNNALDIFLATLESRDPYAKESICEEIEKTNFVGTLIDNMDSADPKVYEKSRNILKIMRSLDYSTPLNEYVKAGANPRIRRELELLLRDEPAA